MNLRKHLHLAPGANTMVLPLFGVLAPIALVFHLSARGATDATEATASQAVRVLVSEDAVTIDGSRVSLTKSERDLVVAGTPSAALTSAFKAARAARADESGSAMIVEAHALLPYTTLYAVLRSAADAGIADFQLKELGH